MLSQMQHGHKYDILEQISSRFVASFPTALSLKIAKNLLNCHEADEIRQCLKHHSVRPKYVMVSVFGVFFVVSVMKTHSTKHRKGTISTKIIHFRTRSKFLVENCLGILVSVNTVESYLWNYNCAVALSVPILWIILEELWSNWLDEI